jgi:hypothetical protein
LVVIVAGVGGSILAFSWTLVKHVDRKIEHVEKKIEHFEAKTTSKIENLEKKIDRLADTFGERDRDRDRGTERA